VTPKLFLRGSVGYTEIYYSDDITTYTFYDVTQTPPQPIQVSINAAPSDTSSIIWNAQANYLLTDLISLDASYAQNFYDSVNEGAVKSNRLTGSIKYIGNVSYAVSGFMAKEEYLSTAREDRSIGANLTASVPISSNITCRIDGTYTHLKSQDNTQLYDEKINRYGARVGIDYRFNKIIVGVGYTWNLNDSNYPDSDYDNNILFAQAKYTF
jgi:uncharacterized protein (PEP-CTERM system associated)